MKVFTSQPAIRIAADTLSGSQRAAYAFHAIRREPKKRDPSQSALRVVGFHSASGEDDSDDPQTSAQQVNTQRASEQRASAAQASAPQASGGQPDWEAGGREAAADPAAPAGDAPPASTVIRGPSRIRAQRPPEATILVTEAAHPRPYFNAISSPAAQRSLATRRSPTQCASPHRAATHRRCVEPRDQRWFGIFVLLVLSLASIASIASL